MENKNTVKRGWSAVIIPAAVLILSVITVNFTAVFGYSDKKAQSIIEELFPTCTVTGSEKKDLGLYVYMQTEKGVDFFVLYKGRQSFYTDYAKAVVTANKEEIESGCPDGVHVDTDDEFYEPFMPEAYNIIFDIDGPEYTESAAKYCMTVQDILDFQYVRSEKYPVKMINYMSFTARYYDNGTGEYIEKGFRKKISFHQHERVSYEEMLVWLNGEYEKGASR